MQPKIVAKPAFTVVGMKYHGSNRNNEIPQLWGKFGPHMHEIQHVVHPHVSYGVMGNYDEVSQEFDYMAALEVDHTTEVAAGMTTWSIPAQRYAVFPCTLATLHQTFDAIQEWLPKSGYRTAAGPEFELYDEQFDPNDPGSTTYVYIPVEAA